MTRVFHIALACLVLIGNGRRVREATVRSRSSEFSERQLNSPRRFDGKSQVPLRALADILSLFRPAAAFQLLSPEMRLPMASRADSVLRPVPARRRNHFARHTVVMAENKNAVMAGNKNAPSELSGDEMEEMWEKLRGRPLRRSFALWRFFTAASIKTVLANRSNNEVRTNATAMWVKKGLLRLGPTMIKLGQVFSSRSDLLHPAYIDALTSLQTAVPCVSGPVVREMLEEELGSPLPFDSFDDVPMAGASLGQVHRAVYQGRDVVVKVQRKKLEELFDTDFRNIRLMCRGLNAVEALGQRIRKWRGKGKSAADRDWLQYANDAARLLYQEIDYVNEGRNAEQFAAAIAEAKASKIVVPKVVWNVTTSRALTMEYVKSVKMTDQDALKNLSLDPKQLVRQVVDSFLIQLLQTGVLHCDPHPGNLCVTPDGDLVFYDYGMMDTLSNETVAGMRKIAFSLFGGLPNPSEADLLKSGESLMEGLELAGFLAEGANRTVVQKVGVFLVRFFKDQAAGRATQDVTEQVGKELQGLLDDGFVSFPSAFTFVGRAFTSVDGIARSLDPGTYDFGRECESFIGCLIEDEYNKMGTAWREELIERAKKFLGISSSPIR